MSKAIAVPFGIVAAIAMLAMFVLGMFAEVVDRLRFQREVI